MSGSGNANSVFYAVNYHPIQAGSIDGTDVLPHDNAVYRALLCSSAGLYDPLGDPKVIGDPYCTVFVGRLSHLTTEDTLRKAMSKYGQVKNLRLVRHIVTGASRGYAFVEYETEKEMLRAYKDAHHSFIDDCEVIVDYNRQQLMPGWIPRRLGGGLGGKKESGQLRFGGRDRPFRAPLRLIPYDELKRLRIDPPPEGRYMTRFEVPSPPKRGGTSRRDESFDRDSIDQEKYGRKSSSIDERDRKHKRSNRSKRHSPEKNITGYRANDRENRTISEERGDHSRHGNSAKREKQSSKRSSEYLDETSRKRSKSHRYESKSSTYEQVPDIE